MNTTAATSMGIAFRLASSKGLTPAKPAPMMQAAATGDMLRPSDPPTQAMFPKPTEVMPN